MSEVKSSRKLVIAIIVILLLSIGPFVTLYNSSSYPIGEGSELIWLIAIAGILAYTVLVICIIGAVIVYGLMKIERQLRANNKQ